MKRTLSLAVAAFAILLIGTPKGADAGFLVSGYSSFADRDNGTGGVQSTLPAGSGNGVVNFAVYENVGGTGNWAVDLFTSMGFAAPLQGGDNPPPDSGGPVDTGAKYVYFYQVVNLGTSDIDQLQVGMQTTLASSVGYISGVSFSDGAAISGLNPYLGADPPPLDYTGMPQEESANGVPTLLYGGPLGFAASAGTVNASGGATPGPGGTIFPNPSSTGNVQFNFVTPAIGLGGGYSTLLFITSSLPFGYLTGTLNDGATTYNELPVPSPVPAALALLISGVPGFLGIGLYLRRKQTMTQA